MTSCDRIRNDLVGFHFGVVDEETRAAVEAHLVGCRACLEELLELKRAIETGDIEASPAPSARSKLRRAVARELGIRDPSRPWAWWERPAAFAFAASTVVAAMIAVRVITAGPGSPPHALSGAHEPGAGEPQR